MPSPMAIPALAIRIGPGETTGALTAAEPVPVAATARAAKGSSGRRRSGSPHPVRMPTLQRNASTKSSHLLPSGAGQPPKSNNSCIGPNAAQQVERCPRAQNSNHDGDDDKDQIVRAMEMMHRARRPDVVVQIEPTTTKKCMLWHVKQGMSGAGLGAGKRVRRPTGSFSAQRGASGPSAGHIHLFRTAMLAIACSRWPRRHCAALVALRAMNSVPRLADRCAVAAPSIRAFGISARKRDGLPAQSRRCRTQLSCSECRARVTPT